MKPRIKPKLTVISGGSVRDAIWRELMEEIIQPRALDIKKVKALEAKLTPRGKLRSGKNDSEPDGRIES